MKIQNKKNQKYLLLLLLLLFCKKIFSKKTTEAPSKVNNDLIFEDTIDNSIVTKQKAPNIVDVKVVNKEAYQRQNDSPYIKLPIFQKPLIKHPIVKLGDPRGREYLNFNPIIDGSKNLENAPIKGFYNGGYMAL